MQLTAQTELYWQLNQLTNLASPIDSIEIFSHGGTSPTLDFTS